MPGVYELGILTTITTTATASLEIVAGAARPMFIEEIEVVNNAATAATFQLGRPGNTPAGGTPTLATLPINRPPGGAASLGGVIINTWGTAPTVPAAGNIHRRTGLPATISAGVLWVWPPEQMVVDPTRSGSLILWNLSVVGAFNIRVKWRE